MLDQSNVAPQAHARVLDHGYGLPVVTHFGAIVRLHRTAAGMTQDQLAEAIGVSRYTIMDWEGGKTADPRPRDLGMAASVLGIAQDAGQLVHLFMAVGWIPGDGQPLTVQPPPPSEFRRLAEAYATLSDDDDRASCLKAVAMTAEWAELKNLCRSVQIGTDKCH